MAHTCDREKRPPVNINGPKLKCSGCNVQCFAKCFGNQATDGSIRFELKDEGVCIIYACDLARTRFVCATCIASVAELQSSSTQLSSTKQTSSRAKDTQKTIRQSSMKEFTSSDRTEQLHDMLSNVQKSIAQAITNVADHRKESKAYTESITTKIDEKVALLSSSIVIRNKHVRLLLRHQIQHRVFTNLSLQLLLQEMQTAQGHYRNWV